MAGSLSFDQPRTLPDVRASFDATRLLAANSNEGYRMFSPDGTQIAYLHSTATAES
jgi:hypothetical protein